MFHTHLPDCVTFLTIFPGVFTGLFRKLPGLNRLKEMSRYVCSLMLIVILSWVYLDNDYRFILPVAMMIICFLFEYVVINWGKFEPLKLRFCIQKMKKPIEIMIIVPYLEELIFRHYLFIGLERFELGAVGFLCISTISFVFAHIFSQGLSSLSKLPLSLCNAILYLMFQNFALCAIVHMGYNIMAYEYNALKYYDARWKNF